MKAEYRPPWEIRETWNREEKNKPGILSSMEKQEERNSEGKNVHGISTFLGIPEEGNSEGKNKFQGKKDAGDKLKKPRQFRNNCDVAWLEIGKKIRQTAVLPKTLKKIRSLPCTPTITFSNNNP